MVRPDRKTTTRYSRDVEAYSPNDNIMLLLLCFRKLYRIIYRLPNITYIVSVGIYYIVHVVKRDGNHDIARGDLKAASVRLHIDITA